MYYKMTAVEGYKKYTEKYMTNEDIEAIEDEIDIAFGIKDAREEKQMIAECMAEFA